MGYAVYQVGKRYGGYGVPSFCEHPDCNEEIDRGMAYACGGEPFSELGCDKYFCEKHRSYTGFKCDGSDELCDHEEDCECTFKEVCASCSGADKQYPYGYPYKPEHPTWIKHLLKDESWAEWRGNNPATVEELKASLKLQRSNGRVKSAVKPA